MSTTRHSTTEEPSFSPKKWVTSLNCPNKGRCFQEDVSNTSSSILTTQNFADTEDFVESKTIISNPLLYQKSRCYNNQQNLKGTPEVSTTLCMNGNGSLPATRYVRY